MDELTTREQMTAATLTLSEQERLDELESVITKSIQTFYEVGSALLEIRESRLYRKTFPTFEDYCQERWQMTRRYANHLIGAAGVMSGLGTIVPKPETESQARELAALPEAEMQKAVWQIALKTAPTSDEGKPLVTAAHVKSVAQVLTDVMMSGGLDDGSGEVKPLGTLIDAAITEETYERMMRQKEHIRGDREFKRQARLAAQVAAIEAMPQPAGSARIHQPSTPTY